VRKHLGRAIAMIGARCGSRASQNSRYDVRRCGRKMRGEASYLPTGTPLVGSYDYTVVAISIGAALAGSLAALELMGRFSALSGRPRLLWQITAAIAQGIGIWAMHYTGMLAFHLPMPTRYDWPMALLSFVIALGGASVAVFVVSQQRLAWRGAVTGSLFMGTAIVGQHYTAMASMRVAADCEYSPPLLVLSAAFAFVFSLLSVRLTFTFRRAVPYWAVRRTVGAVLMTVAICAMHYTAMAAVTFVTVRRPPDWSHAVVISDLGSIGIGSVTVALMGVAIVSSTYARRRRAFQDLRAFSEGLRSAREVDAKRMARELHDEVGSLLTSVKWELERLEEHCDAAARPAFRAMAHRIEETLDRVRRIASELRSPLLDELGLEASIEEEARQFAIRTGIACRVDVLLDEGTGPDSAQSTALYRILQEGLTNVGRHAQATRVNVLLEERNGDIALEIRDNGIGIPDDALHAPSSLGLVGMRERAELMNGRIEFSRATGRGTVITALLPVRRGPRHES
jgi:signal transduction histidine kinase